MVLGALFRFLLHQLDFCHARVHDIVHWSKSRCTRTCILHCVQMAIHICATMVYCHANCYSLISAWNRLVYIWVLKNENFFSYPEFMSAAPPLRLNPLITLPKLGFLCGCPLPTILALYVRHSLKYNLKLMSNESLYFLEWQRYTWLIEHQHNNTCTTWTTLDCLFTWLFKVLSIIVSWSHISLDQYIPVHV